MNKIFIVFALGYILSFVALKFNETAATVAFISSLLGATICLMDIYDEN